jgi:hypothetical protein
MKKIINSGVLELAAWALIGNLGMIGGLKIKDRPVTVLAIVTGTIAGPIAPLILGMMFLFENLDTCVANCEK